MILGLSKRRIKWKFRLSQSSFDQGDVVFSTSPFRPIRQRHILTKSELSATLSTPTQAQQHCPCFPGAPCTSRVCAMLQKHRRHHTFFFVSTFCSVACTPKEKKKETRSRGEDGRFSVRRRGEKPRQRAFSALWT
ncbi:unnamed protein product [Ixodes pacificus]